MGLRRSCAPLAEANGEKQVPPLGLKSFHIWCIGDGWSTPSGVHSCRQFLDRALAPEVMFPSPQRLKAVSFPNLNCTASTPARAKTACAGDPGAEAVLHPTHQV